jgi:hypothetical protein
MNAEYIYDVNDEGALNAIALELLDAYLLSVDGDEIRERIAGVKARECSECLEFNLDSNACADHKGECYSCCGCGLLEDAAAK